MLRSYSREKNAEARFNLLYRVQNKHLPILGTRLDMIIEHTIRTAEVIFLVVLARW